MKRHCDLCGMSSRHWDGCTLDPKNMNSKDREVVAHRVDGSAVLMGELRYKAER